MAIPAPETGYVLYGGELSYFTRKLEAALIFYGVPFERRDKDPAIAPEIEARAGTHQIPVLHTPENWMIADTTPIMRMLDGRFPSRRMFPAGPTGVLVQIVEEFFDEWVARTMVHYRWHYPDSALFASLRIARGHAEIAERVRGWGPRACRATGTESPHQQAQAELEYRRMLDAMEAQLAATRYLMGDRPTAVDCIVLGGLRAHTWMDPDPKRVVAGYPKVIEWCERAADRWDGTGELPQFPETTRFGRAVLAEMAGSYRSFVLANGAAMAAGAKACTAEIYGEPVSFLVRPYPERSRRMIADAIVNTCSAAEQHRVHDWLAGLGLAECFSSGSGR